MNDVNSVDKAYDVIVVGGGPAGTTVASLVAREGGRSVLLLDRELFPRFRIGESLMPATYWTFKRLDVLDKLERSDFPRKHSVQFFSKSGRSSSPFYFSEFDAHESSVTWQVDRAAFDQMLLEHAAASGATVRQQANVREVLFDGKRAHGVEVEMADGSRSRVEAKVVVDATGQTAMIARKLGLKDLDPALKHAAYYTRYRGAKRDPGVDEGATLILHTDEPRCWFWYIPLPDDIVSVGVVGPTDTLSSRGADPQAVYDALKQHCPVLQERTQDAERIEGVSVIRDFSYISTRIAGDGWVMVGDAFGFLDPIYSTGVFLALQSAELATDSILAAFRLDDFSGARLGQHGAHYVAGMEAMRKLVYAYYDESFHVPQFLQAHPEHRESIVDLLIGNVFRKPHDGLFEAMGRMTELPEARTLLPLEPRH
jgi:flavin-dependent dehydrogenase